MRRSCARDERPRGGRRPGRAHQVVLGRQEHVQAEIVERSGGRDDGGERRDGRHELALKAARIGRGCQPPQQQQQQQSELGSMDLTAAQMGSAPPSQHTAWSGAGDTIPVHSHAQRTGGWGPAQGTRAAQESYAPTGGAQGRQGQWGAAPQQADYAGGERSEGVGQKVKGVCISSTEKYLRRS